MEEKKYFDKGKHNKLFNGTPIDCYTMDGKLFRRYACIADAERDLGIKVNLIRKQLRTNIQVNDTYYFKKSNYKFKNYMDYAIEQYTLDWEYIRTWKNPKEVVENLGLKYPDKQYIISNANYNSGLDCKRGCKTQAYGYKWVWVEKPKILDEYDFDFAVVDTPKDYSKSYVRGKNNSKSKPVLQCYPDGKVYKEWECLSDITKYYKEQGKQGYSRQNIRDICDLGYDALYKGYLWKWKNKSDRNLKNKDNGYRKKTKENRKEKNTKNNIDNSSKKFTEI